MASHIFKQRWLWKFSNLMDMEVKGKTILIIAGYGVEDGILHST
jgi:hypothetical protein